jgi:alkaline phosphatase
MRVLVSPVVAVVAFLVGIFLTIAYAAFIGLPLSLPFGQPGSSTQPPGGPTAASPAASARASSPPTASTPQASSNSVAVLVGAGDIAMCAHFQDEATAAAIERTPGTVFTLGDNVYPEGDRNSYRDCYGPSWGLPSIKDRTRPTPGGNEYKVARAAAYFDYFGAAAGDPDTGYYAYELGAWRVYVLNSNCHEVGGCIVDSKQEVWLRHDLAQHPSQCVLAMWHHPLFSSGQAGGIGLTTALWRDLENAGAELVLNGNHHAYERFAPQTVQGVADDQHGLVEIVVGTGGAERGSFGPPADNSLVRATGAFGVLRLELAPNAYRFEFLSTGGKNLSDSGSGTCH